MRITNLEGKIILMNKLEEMGFKETETLEPYRISLYKRGKEEKIVVVRLLAFKEAIQVLYHSQKKEEIYRKEV